MIASSPQTTLASDLDLERRIVNYLAARHVPGIRWVEVSVSHGIATLQGTVRSFHQKQLCYHSTRRVAGVVGVIDELSVE